MAGRGHKESVGGGFQFTPKPTFIPHCRGVSYLNRRLIENPPPTLVRPPQEN
jgi:hypothetical protein